MGVHHLREGCDVSPRIEGHWRASRCSRASFLADAFNRMLEKGAPFTTEPIIITATRLRGAWPSRHLVTNRWRLLEHGNDNSRNYSSARRR